MGPQAGVAVSGGASDLLPVLDWLELVIAMTARLAIAMEEGDVVVEVGRLID